MTIPEYLIFLMRNICPSQEATVWMEYGSRLAKECSKAIFSPYLFNLYDKYISKEAGLEKDECGFKVGGRNINSLAVDDTA